MFCRKRSIIVLLAALVLLLSGCGGKATPAPSGSAHESAAAASSAAAETPSPVPTPSPSPTPVPTPTPDPKSVAEGNWIAGIPDYVPKFDCGKLDENVCKVVEGPVSSVFALRFSGIAKADVDKYGELLKSEGYVVAVEAIDDTYTLTASLNRGREIATLVITFSEASGVAIFTLGAAV